MARRPSVTSASESPKRIRGSTGLVQQRPRVSERPSEEKMGVLGLASARRDLSVTSRSDLASRFCPDLSFEDLASVAVTRQRFDVAATVEK